MVRDPCPVCDSDNQGWPIVDAATGWTFCGCCYNAVLKRVNVAWRVPVGMSAWLRAVADERDAHQTKEAMVEGVRV